MLAKGHHHGNHERALMDTFGTVTIAAPRVWLDTGVVRWGGVPREPFVQRHVLANLSKLPQALIESIDALVAWRQGGRSGNGQA